MNATDNPTKVSEVQIVPIRPQDGLIAFASCVLDGKFFVGSIGIYTKLAGGYRITFPTKKVGITGMNVSIFNPITSESCTAITQAILQKANALFNQNREYGRQ